MSTQSGREWELYQARRKALQDLAAWVDSVNRQREEAVKEGRQKGREEGREQGRQKGFEEGLEEGQIDIIHFCERFLKRPQTPTEQLAAISLTELTRLADERREQILRARGAG
jgi:flagellar biosynthesis/type III secretory pathway protein FliH